MRLTLALLLLLPSSLAAAQTTNPCAKMKDPVGCGCAVATGGSVSGASWARGPDKHGFESCLASRGSAAVSTRPATIPGRF